MRVLLTGGAGFIGSQIADLLDEAGHDVVLLDALLPVAHGHGSIPSWVDRDRLVHGDIREPELLDRLLPGIDVVCHQAAMVGQGIDPSDAPAYASHNDLGTATLLAAMYRAGVQRLVLASSMVVYGEGRYRCATHGTVSPGQREQKAIDAGEFEPPCPDCGCALAPELVPENAPISPRGIYAATKLAQENLTASWARASGGGAFAMRYHNVYGPRMPRDTPYAGVASIFRSSLERGRPPQVMEDGAQRRDFVHVRDVARAVTLAIAAIADSGTCTPLNVCSGEPRTIGQMASTLATCMNGPQPEIIGGTRAGDVRHLVADPRRAEEILGFRASIGFTEGMAEFATAPLRESATRS